MRLNLISARLAQVKAAYRIVFGHPVPDVVCEGYEPGELLILLDKAIREMKPLDQTGLQRPAYSRAGSRLSPLPLSARALARWQYMRRH
jgi:hypothetical protein